MKRVLLLAREWTPGVEATAREFKRLGRDVHVITCRRNGQPEIEKHRGLHLHGIEEPEGSSRSIQWSASLNIRLAAMGSRVLTTYGKFDLLVAYDEQVADGTAVLAEKARLPQQRSLSPMEVNG